MRRKDQWSVRARRIKIVRIALATLAVAGLIWVVFIRPPYTSTATSEPSADEWTSAEPQPPDEPSSSIVTALQERSQKFAELYYSYDWQRPNERVKELAAFGDKPWLASVKQAEKDIVRQGMRKMHSEHRVTSVEFQDGGPENENSPVDTVSMTLNVQKTIEDDTTAQPMTLTFSCNLLWKYDATSKTWLISRTDPT